VFNLNFLEYFLSAEINCFLKMVGKKRSYRGLQLDTSMGLYFYEL
jgi:hypothetical protein